MEPARRIYSTPQAAVELGLSFNSVRELARRGAIVSQKNGRKYRFTQDALNTFKITYKVQLSAYAERNKKIVLPPVRFKNADYIAANEMLLDLGH